MKKNILIIGYGDIARRLTSILCKDSYKIYGISRRKKRGLENFIEWDWLSKKPIKLECEHFESIIFIPKPSNNNLSGYQDGFLNSSENFFNFLEFSENIFYKKFITISSTSVYGEIKDLKTHIESPKLKEEDSQRSSLEFRGQIVTEYENSQIKRYAERLIILRLSGLYKSKPKSKNYLHRDNAAKIIKFFIQSDNNFNSYEIFNCTEDSKSNGYISNQKLKQLGFVFDIYN